MSKKTIIIFFGLLILTVVITYFYKAGSPTIVHSPDILPPLPNMDTGCKISGCSGEICGENEGGIVTTCLYRSEYECYKNARCERQANDRCGWTITPLLKDCLQKAGSQPSLDVF